MILLVRNFSGQLYFEVIYTAATAKLVSCVVVTHEAELAPTLMAYFHDVSSFSE